VYIKQGVISHGDDILRQLWWRKHGRLFRIVCIGCAAIVATLLWSSAMHVALARMLASPYYG
jgi:hypothetical protein